MIVSLIVIITLSAKLATARINSDSRSDVKVLAEAILEGIIDSQDYPNRSYERNEDEDYARIVDQLKEIKRKYSQRPRIKPYENYAIKREEKFYLRQYKNALLKLYKDLAKAKAEKNNVSDDKIKKESVKHDKESYVSISKRNFDIHDDKLSGNDNGNKKYQEMSHDVNIKRNIVGDNVQVAHVMIDNSFERNEDFVSHLDPKELFLDPETNETKNNNVTNKPPYHGHIKQGPPPPDVSSSKHPHHHGLDEKSFIAIIVGCSVAGVAGILLASFCWYKLRQESNKKSLNRSPPSSLKKDVFKEKGKNDDDKLVESAEVFHYLHAKNQMQQMSEPRIKADYSPGGTSDEEDEDTVYECPGLAMPGDMKVVNPLFSDAESHHSDKNESPVSDNGQSPTPPPPTFVQPPPQQTQAP